MYRKGVSNGVSLFQGVNVNQGELYKGHIL